LAQVNATCLPAGRVPSSACGLPTSLFELRGTGQAGRREEKVSGSLNSCLLVATWYERKQRRKSCFPTRKDERVIFVRQSAVILLRPSSYPGRLRETRGYGAREEGVSGWLEWSSFICILVSEDTLFFPARLQCCP